MPFQWLMKSIGERIGLRVYLVLEIRFYLNCEYYRQSCSSEKKALKRARRIKMKQESGWCFISSLVFEKERKISNIEFSVIWLTLCSVLQEFLLRFAHISKIIVQFQFSFLLYFRIDSLVYSWVYWCFIFSEIFCSLLKKCICVFILLFTGAREHKKVQTWRSSGQQPEEVYFTLL